jgi:uncharacterized protein (DUF2249 family)
MMVSTAKVAVRRRTAIAEEPTMPSDALPPPWVAKASGHVTRRFRLEDLLAGGDDPPAVIAGAARALGEGETLTVDAPVEPIPLRALLGRAGMETWAAALGDGRWRLHVRRAPGATPAEAARLVASASGRGVFWLEDGRVNLDVRALPPPYPLTEILRVIDDGLAGDEMVVYLPLHPVHLFPLLEERGWSWRVLPGRPCESPAGQETADTVRLLLSREDRP